MNETISRTIVITAKGKSKVKEIIEHAESLVGSVFDINICSSHTMKEAGFIVAATKDDKNLLKLFLEVNFDTLVGQNNEVEFSDFPGNISIDTKNFILASLRCLTPKTEILSDW